jgi:uncharacterized membrane protein
MLTEQGCGFVWWLGAHDTVLPRCSIEKLFKCAAARAPNTVNQPPHNSEADSNLSQNAEQLAQHLRDSHFRSVIKAVSWRVIGTIDTIVISYLWTGMGAKAFAIGGSEVITKVGLYYLHERVWASVPLGTVRRLNPGFEAGSESIANADAPLRDSKLRSLIKAVSWRVVGTLDTIFVSYLWTGDTSKALVIGGTDVLTKIVFYYLHERAWARIPLGTIRRIFKR